MIGALWTGISGLSSQQQALDNESNNIANVNTIGFKSSRISFADQMYQDRIGKGSKILDAEKLYTQGNLKLTGVNYDMALSGDGFFTVVNTRSAGASESLYTRAGNFRMGDNGTLQDAAGNEVQGWMMTAIDSQNDVTSTNPNVSVFTNDYTKLLSSKVIRHGTYVDTITAKATDYTKTAKSDSTTAFGGDGAKTKSSKISDIEEAIKDYSNWLQKLKDEPDGASSTSISQVSQINFKSGSESILGKDGDQVYVYIDGNKISQNFLLTSADDNLKATLYAADQALAPADRIGYVDPSTFGSLTTTQLDAANAMYNKEAGKIATYAALADKISQIPGLVATMVKETSSGTGTADVLEIDDTFEPSTKNLDMLKGIIQIKALIPGDEFVVSEVAEISGNTTVQGNYQNTSLASKGSGIGALETSRDALAKLITGKQQDVYTAGNLGIGSSSGNYSYGISIYDKELDINIPIPNDGAVPPQAVNQILENADTIDKIADQINGNVDLSKYVVARNVNGNLVIQTLDSNYDVEFTGNIKQLPSVRIDLNEVVDNADYTFDINVNGTPTLFSLSTGTPPLNNPNTLTYSEIYTNIKGQIDLYNLNPLNTDKLGVTSLSSDGRFSIYTTDETVSFAGSSSSINGEQLPVVNTNTTTALSPTVLEETTLTVAPIAAGTYNLIIDGTPITYTATSVDPATFYAGLLSEIQSSTPYTNNLITATSGVGGVVITNKDLTITSPNITVTDGGLFQTGMAKVITHNIDDGDKSNKSISVITLTINGETLRYKTDNTPTTVEIRTSLNNQILANPNLSNLVTIGGTGNDITVTGVNTPANGFVDFTSTLTSNSLQNANDGYETLSTTVNEITPIDVNANYSGRKGAGAEFIELVNKVDQTASKGSLQLRLDTLGISDSAFGEFSVDSTGLITMKQDGAEYAVGQVAIAVFNNNRGLDPVGDNLLAKTNESGEAIYNLNNNKTAKVEAKTLELSTADLSESLVNLMVFQRAFEANAKSITTSDELLNTLINLKR